tara:strand:+ start:1831 stop:2880 length:1050 start_codon:yes stop_codon:yes gene_type:complete
MPLTFANWQSARIKFENSTFSNCDTVLKKAGGSKERCATGVHEHLNVWIPWVLQAWLLFVLLPNLCNRILCNAESAEYASKIQDNVKKSCLTWWHWLERFVLPFGMLIGLCYVFIKSVDEDTFTLWYFTFFTVSTQIICNLVLALRVFLEKCTSKAEEGQQQRVKGGRDAVTHVVLYSHIILSHTFACTVFIVSALLIFAVSNRELLHVLFIYKLLGHAPGVLGNELIHTVPVLVYLFLVKTHYHGEIGCTGKFLSDYLKDLREQPHCILGIFKNDFDHWWLFLLLLQLPSFSYILLVDWNCVYGRLVPFLGIEDEIVSTVAYIVFASCFFFLIHAYVMKRALLRSQWQ